MVDLFERMDRLRLNLALEKGNAMEQILGVGSPIGYQLRNRYINIGVPISEALSLNRDPVFREKLVDMARWSKEEVRANALVVLAETRDPAHFRIFSEAIVHLDPGVRFGALEALLVWGAIDPEKIKPVLAAASEKDPEPILRVYSAAGLAKLGDDRGLEKLRRLVDDPSWIMRAMAGRFLGEYGTAADYDLLVGRIGRETTNDFVLAEFCIAALKLFPKKPA